MEAVTSCFFALWNVAASSRSLSSNLGAHWRHNANALPIISSFLRNDPSAWHLICTPPLRAVVLVILCRSPALPSALLIIWLTFVQCTASNFFTSSFYFISRSQSCHFCMVPSHPARSQAFSRSAANNSLTHQLLCASILSFALIVCHILHYLPRSSLPAYFCVRCKLYPLNQTKILAQQSSLHLRIRCFLLLRTNLHSRGAPLPL